MARRHWLGWTSVAAVVTLAVACDKEKSDETPSQPPPPPAAAPALWRPTTHPGVLDPGDLLAVRVAGLIEPTVPEPMVARVQADGSVSLLYLSPVGVAGLTPVEAGGRITEAYRTNNILSNGYAEVRRLQVAGTGGAPPGPIAAHDLVRCVVGGLYDPKSGVAVTVRRVDARGDLAVPQIPPVRVAGLTDDRAAAAVSAAYRSANMISNAPVAVLVLERAPADAASKSLPDEPLNPLPETLRFLYADR